MIVGWYTKKWWIFALSNERKDRGADHRLGLARQERVVPRRRPPLDRTSFVPVKWARP
jgi:hypothetical protein